MKFPMEPDKSSLILRKKLNKPCKDCKQVFNPWQMDFDHRPGTHKIKNLSQMRRERDKKILEEIAKCDLVCANCHRQRTWMREHLNG